MKELEKISVLLVEDETDLRREILAYLELFCGRVLPAANGREGLELFKTQRPDVVVSDIRMPVMDGLEMAARLKELAPDTPVIFCTAFSETSFLLRAIDLGVAGFVRKPMDTDELMAVIRRATVPILQRREIEDLAVERTDSLLAWMGTGPALKALSETVNRVSRTPFNVLLQGETGSGKSHLAGIIHALSPRRDRPFTSVHLGTIPEGLVESELFGHLKGAFTGAVTNRTGLVEAAEGGTLLLDDIETCTPAVQAKLLRFVDEKRFVPLGGSTEKTGDVRIISASNQDLKTAVQAGRFREDLYYRLADFVILLPPLRQIPDAIIPLSLKFLKEVCDELGRDVPLLAEEARRLLTEGLWPGNIRELKSVIRRSALSAGNLLSAAEIAAVVPSPGPEAAPLRSPETPAPPPFPCRMEDLERWTLEQALRFCGGMRMKTAAMLGLNYYTFRRKLEKHGISASR